VCCINFRDFLVTNGKRGWNLGDKILGNLVDSTCAKIGKKDKIWNKTAWVQTHNHQHWLLHFRTYWLVVTLAAGSSIWANHDPEHCLFVFWRDSPQRDSGSSFTRFLDHTPRRTPIGRTPQNEWSARHRDFYLTTHNNDNRQTTMHPVEFEPKISAGERLQTYALHHAAIGISMIRSLGGWISAGRPCNHI
jgi:hypothetical protein